MAEACVINEPLDLRQLERVSPSKFTMLSACQLRVVWASCNAPMLPASPSARLGSAIHAVLEVAGKGQLDAQDEKALRTAADDAIRAAERHMEESWLERRFIPLKKHVPDYQVRLIRALRQVKQVAGSHKASLSCGGSTPGIGYEIWVESADGRIAGRIDYALPSHCGVTIGDYKTGYISESAGSTAAAEVNANYSAQIRIYAALYASMFGKWPCKLEITPLSGEPVEMAFTAADCESLLARAVELLGSTNRLIRLVNTGATRVDSLANPSATACKFCHFRPVCSAYQKKRESDAATPWPFDAFGHLRRFEKQGNGKIYLEVEGVSVPNRVWRIRSIEAETNLHPALRLLESGCKIAVCNLKPTQFVGSFAETPYTVIYKYEDFEVF